MPASILVGAQWGDEGKGKITDLIARDFDVVCRYSGGANAGHTVVVGSTKLALHQIPSGIMYKNCLAVIGNGCIVDPTVVLQEIETLEGEGVSCKNLRISGKAHLVMPYHKVLDGAQEVLRGDKHIGTTKRGVGPTYSDKMLRIGLRMQDLLDESVFKTNLADTLTYVNALLEHVFHLPTYTVQQICDEYLPYAKRLAPYIVESTLLLHEALDNKQSILFEGAQATMLDIDHGTYPFVTSSNCTAGGATTGSGVGPTQISRVIGVAKAYLTRVGSGPFPTELTDEDGEKLRQVGAEFGVTTGRARRCGWYDAPVVRYSAQINGLTDLAITKLDVLSCMPTIKICVAYDCAGKRYTSVPEYEHLFECAKPVYETMPGWNCDISHARTFDDLPQQAQNYIARIEELSGVRVSIVAVGPDREQTINRSW